jgi:PAS domain S-box-containing protein
MESEVEPVVESSVFQIESPIKVLHVDDETEFLKVAKQCLEMQGNFKIETASSVDEALKTMKKKVFDVVISDYQMPGKSGLDFLKSLRDAGNRIPFIMFTGRGREEIAIRALNLGADWYINKSGNPEAVYCELSHAVQQIILKVLAQRQAKDSEQRFRCLVEDAAVSIGIANLRGHFTYVNKAMSDLLGYSRSELIGSAFKDYLHPKDRGKIMRLFLRSLLSILKPRRIEFRVIRKDGRILHLTSKPTRLTVGGKTIGFQAIITDITERKRTEKALVESEEKWRTLAEQSPNMIFVNKKGRVVFANKRCEEIMGYKEQDFYSPDFSFLQLFASESVDLVKSKFSRHLKGEEVAPYESTLATKDGERIEVIISTRLIEYEGERAILGIITDITKRKRAEKSLRESEERFKAIFKGATDGILAAHLKTKRFAFANPKLCEMTGYTLEEVLKLDVTKLHPEEDLPYVLDQFEKQVQGKKTLAKNIPVLRKDRTVIFCDVNSKTMKIGEEKYLLGFFRDITERKRAEEKLISVNEKLNVVGKLTRHDVRNKLSAITGNVYLAKQKTLSSEIQEHLEGIDSSISQIVRIFDFASAYEKLGVEDLSTIDAGKAVDEAVSLFPDLTDVKVVNDCHGLTVLADSLLRQLFYNLIHNSLEHGERVSQIRMFSSETGEDTIELVYEDDGVGIPKTEKEKIFVKGYGKGTGYGLYLIRKMCSVYGWSIRETGKEGKGAQFTMTISRTDRDGKPGYEISR